MFTVGQDILLQHKDNEYSYLTNSFNAEMVHAMVAKNEDDSGFKVESMKYFVIPAAVGFVYLY